MRLIGATDTHLAYDITPSRQGGGDRLILLRNIDLAKWFSEPRFKYPNQHPKHWHEMHHEAVNLALRLNQDAAAVHRLSGKSGPEHDAKRKEVLEGIHETSRRVHSLMGGLAKHIHAEHRAHAEGIARIFGGYRPLQYGPEHTAHDIVDMAARRAHGMLNRNRRALDKHTSPYLEEASAKHRKARPA